MFAVDLSLEITFAIIRFEKGADGEVAIEGKKRTRGSVKSGDSSIRPPGFEDIPSHRSIPQFLGRGEVLLPGQTIKFCAVLFKVVIKIPPGFETYIFVKLAG